jgi:fumarylpyruvate hydrolase
MATPDGEGRGRRAMRIPPFNTYLGTEFVRRGEGEVEVALELQPHHLNRRGVAHGGVVTALLDSALGAAVISSMPPEWWCATTSLSTQFIGGAGAGRLFATGRLLRRGRHVAFAGGEVRDAAGKLIATASGTWHLWHHRPDAPRRTETGPFIVLRDGGRRLRVGKILAVGRNYTDHVAEMKAPAGRPPVFFLKPPSAIVSGGGSVELPTDAGSVHHEVEMVLAIGRAGRAIPAERAMEHVLGFAVGLDLTLRDVQSEAKRHGEPWSLAKGFDGSAPLSAVAPRDEVGDGSGLTIRLEVNGELRQSGNTAQMLRTSAELVAEASRWLTLDPGDLIFTGTPAGVGPLAPGDRLEATLEKVGKLVLTVAARTG